MRKHILRANKKKITEDFFLSNVITNDIHQFKHFRHKIFHQR